MGYVPGKLIVTKTPRRPPATSRPRDALRLGIASQLISQAGFIFVALALYDLLKGVNRRQARSCDIDCGLIPIAFVNELNSIAASPRARR